MQVPFLAEYEGKCPRCGREYHVAQDDVVVCDCFEKCPLCGAKMEPYTPDISPNTYGIDGKRDLQVIRVCNNTADHSDQSPYFSTQQPIQVELERLTE